jgi:uncharacterized protein (TIGR02757 family)
MDARANLPAYLDSLVHRFENPSFIAADPIAIPHGFDDPRDQEVIGLYSALLAWGRRATTLAKMEQLCELMDYRPYEFVLAFGDAEHDSQLQSFVHRTFQPTDAVSLTRNLSEVLRRHGSLESVFADGLPSRDADVGPAIQHFSETVLSIRPDTPGRLSKHLPRPNRGSACKRLCMYLRWMVRPGPFDLAIWRRISPSQLVLPLDVHSGRQARALGLLQRKANDWSAALELTSACRRFDRDDPCRYDLALFGLGAYGPEEPGFHAP